jgi:hypothetical protein
MAASFNLTLPGVGDQIAASVAESLKHIQTSDKGPSASSIGDEVGKKVATVLEIALSEVKKPTFDVREQILGRFASAHVLEDWSFTSLNSQRRCNP